MVGIKKVTRFNTLSSLKREREKKVRKREKTSWLSVCVNILSLLYYPRVFYI